MKTPFFLLAEDDEDDFMIFKKAHDSIQGAQELVWVKNGQELVNYLENILKEKQLLPSLIICDVNMPIMNGLEALVTIKNNENFKMIPFILFSTSQSATKVLECYQNGAAAYIKKPENFDHLSQILQSCYKFWFECVLLPNRL